MGLGCVNTQTLDRYRRTYSSKAVLALKLESAFNSKTKRKNVVLSAFRSFAFSQSQGHLWT